MISGDGVPLLLSDWGTRPPVSPPPGVGTHGRDSGIVQVLNNGFKSVFTIDDEYTLPLLQPQTETVGDWKCKQGTCDKVYKKNQAKHGRGAR